jgi:type IV pilus assembly protein PilE
MMMQDTRHRTDLRENGEITMSHQQSTLANRSHLAASGQRQRGFTLIEVMIVAAVVAILAMIAFPSYQDSVRKSRRAEAKSALSDLAARQEQFYNDNKTYADTIAKLGTTATTPSGYYTLQIAPGATLTLASSFLLTATAAGVQTSDAKCTTFTYTSSGKKDSTPAGNTCW